MEKNSDTSYMEKCGIQWVLDMLISAALKGSYGDFIITFQEGKVVNVKRIENLKPPKNPK